jgi:hypothetical protein
MRKLKYLKRKKAKKIFCKRKYFSFAVFDVGVKLDFGNQRKEMNFVDGSWNGANVFDGDRPFVGCSRHENLWHVAPFFFDLDGFANLGEI